MADDPKANAAHVIFTSGAGKKAVTLNVLLGDGSPTLNSGVTTWDTVARPKRTSLTRFSGRTPYGQDIPIMFDGVTNDPNNASQEDRISKLETMSRDARLISLGGVALH